MATAPVNKELRDYTERMRWARVLSSVFYQQDAPLMRSAFPASVALNIL